MDWFENEDFWRDFFPCMFPPERMAAADGQAAQILALTGVQNGQVLDLCCGPGRHSVAFAQLGFAVTGVDRTAYLLDKARQAAAAAGTRIEWVQEDMRRFVRPDSFDLACSLFTSFGYFEREEEDLQVLRNVLASLKPGGVFVLDVLGKERLASIFGSPRCSEVGGALWLQRTSVLRDWTRVRNSWTLIANGAVINHEFEHFVYSGRELRDLLLRAGFAEVRLYGDLGGSEYGANATRLVAAARKDAAAPSPVKEQ